MIFFSLFLNKIQLPDSKISALAVLSLVTTTVPSNYQQIRPAVVTESIICIDTSSSMISCIIKMIPDITKKTTWKNNSMKLIKGRRIFNIYFCRSLYLNSKYMDIYFNLIF